MDRPVVVDGVSKRYELGTAQHGALSQHLESLVRAPVRKLLGGSGEVREVEEFWALRNVSLEVDHGEVLGMVGPNGAGKSTLLKLLARITEPTEGQITMQGRVGSLLEVGTGFHPELTGRENVFLNGAILGMRRREIMARYDEIVTFSGVERFLETPVKRYSSGMYVRLAFAVAAHLDPEILIVDEVLSVGDAEFQRRCLGKMDEVAGQGRTVLLVSHNLSVIQSMCSRAILLDGGEVQIDGDPEDVVAKYLDRNAPQVTEGKAVIDPDAERVGTGEARLRDVVLANPAGDETQEFRMGEPITVTVTAEVQEPLEDIVLEVAISTLDGEVIISSHSTDGENPAADIPAGTVEFTVELEAHLLPHEFVIGAGIHRRDGDTVDWVVRAHGFTVLNEDVDGRDPYPWEHVRGYSRPKARWTGVTASALPR